MTYDAILKEVKSRKFRPVYLLHGAEPYFIDQLSDAIEAHVLEEHERAFNQTILYGRETDYLQVLDAARRFPMMAARQLVILREAQEMRTLKDLQSYVERPADTTVLVICHKYKKLPFNTKFGKAVKDHALVFESKPLYDNEVPAWVEEYLRTRRLTIEPAAAALLAEYLGTDLAKIANELDKLALNVAAGTRISSDIIEEQIGISKDYNVFELQRALAQRDVLRTYRIVDYFAANPRKNPLPVVLSSLYGYFAKVYQLHELQARQAAETDILQALQLRSNFFLKEYRQATRHFTRAQTEQVFALLREYDLKSKGVDWNSTGKGEGELLREMVWRMLH